MGKSEKQAGREIIAETWPTKGQGIDWEGEKGRRGGVYSDAKKKEERSEKGGRRRAAQNDGLTATPIRPSKRSDIEGTMGCSSMALIRSTSNVTYSVVFHL